MRGTFDAEIKNAVAANKKPMKGKKKMPFPMRKASKNGEAVDNMAPMFKGKGGR